MTDKRESPLALMVRKFRRHKAAVGAFVVIVLFYLAAVFAPFIAPYGTSSVSTDYLYAPPNILRIDGQGLFFYKYTRTTDEETWREIYTIEPDPSNKVRVRLFAEGEPYSFFGLKTDRHLFLPSEEYPLFLFGSDALGRDLFSRILYGSRISLTVGLIGILFSLVLGLVIGGISGLLGGVADSVIQRIIEALISIPTIPLWMALSAILPLNWSQVKVYFGITIILSLVGWTGIARVVRSKFLSLRNEDFVNAARTFGAGRSWLITRHLIPSFMSYVIVTASMMMPGMILGETGLSFLGLGLRDPTVSWGTLLNGAQKISVIALYPWLMMPALFIIVVILAFNFVGDGLRDVADPYSDLN